MDGRHRGLWLACAVATIGCYRAHGVDGDDDARTLDVGGRLDAGRDASLDVRDARIRSETGRRDAPEAPDTPPDAIDWSLHCTEDPPLPTTICSPEVAECYAGCWDEPTPHLCRSACRSEFDCARCIFLTDFQVAKENGCGDAYFPAYCCLVVRAAYDCDGPSPHPSCSSWTCFPEIEDARRCMELARPDAWEIVDARCMVPPE